LIIEYRGKRPFIAKKTFIAESADVIGDVTIEEYASIWYNATVRGDINSIKIGTCSNIQDGSVLHVSYENNVEIGDYVTIGHTAIIHGCTIGDNSLIGMGSIISEGVVIERNVLVGAGTLIPPGKIIPSGTLVLGVPGKIIREITEDEIRNIRQMALNYKDYWINSSYKRI
jgi:carbonic anhydrase/acetyltransferase-like protein (isoleucine patch superfamily)